MLNGITQSYLPLTRLNSQGRATPGNNLHTPSSTAVITAYWLLHISPTHGKEGSLCPGGKRRVGEYIYIYISPNKAATN